MRNPEAVLDALMTFAAADARVRALLLTGSRVNPAHAPDALSDYDVLLSVTDVESFARDQGWIARFGRVWLMQRPADPPPRRAWLIVFDDGVRIDFTFSPVELLAEDAQADSLTRLLLDKDGRLPPLPPSSTRSHLVRPPTQAEFSARFNEVWWVLVYAAKGLRRGQITYANHALDAIVRPEMVTILAWAAGLRHGWTVNPGTAGKYLRDLLPPDIWEGWLGTFAAGDVEENWRALDAVHALCDRLGRELAAALALEYDASEAEHALSLLHAIRNLPRLDPDVSLDLHSDA